MDVDMTTASQPSFDAEGGGSNAVEFQVEGGVVEVQVEGAGTD